MNKYENGNRNRNQRERQIYKDYDIFPGKIRLIRNDGTSAIIDRDEAIVMAREQGMNLVQVAYNKTAEPRSTCKIYDFSKMKYEQKKRDKEAAKKSRIANAEAKEIVFTIRIDDGDFNHKLTQIRDFLIKDELKVKITVKLTKREMFTVKRMAVDLIKRILSNFDNFAVLDNKPSDTGRMISCVLRPIKKNIITVS
jgi:translation initiation factor IF-3